MRVKAWQPTAQVANLPHPKKQRHAKMSFLSLPVYLLGCDSVPQALLYGRLCQLLFLGF